MASSQESESESVKLPRLRLRTAAAELRMTEAMWNESKRLLEELEQPYAVTLRFYSATLTPGAFTKE